LKTPEIEEYHHVLLNMTGLNHNARNPEYGKTVHVVFCSLKIRNAGIMAHIVRREYEAFKRS
jgi:hypothetical protein